MKKLKFYVLVLCSAMSVVSCDAIGRNKSALNELGKELAAVAGGAQKPEAVGSVAADAGDRLQMQKTPAGTPEQILRRTAYVASYNKETKLPNWVAWHLTADRTTGPAKRSGVDFEADADVPAPRAEDSDYYGSGYDRGHMCPAGDNRWHWRAMQESFYMTNICPQHHNLNRGDWKELEDDCREWAEKEGRIYIACGPIFYKGKPRTIGREHKVAVPDAFFKVILCADSRPPRAIGFIYKNTSGNHPLDHYVNSVDQVERITGIDFFPALPDDVEREVESGYNLKLWK